MGFLHTLLELGHSTSSNLGLAYDLSPRISYGEETITESNLLEIQRRHPRLTRIETFSKHVESSKTGADWEWHLIGRAWTLKLRVQAKRVTKTGDLKGILQKSKTARHTQVDLLINSSKQDGLRPIYCFYCAEKHREIWTTDHVGGYGEARETGCLLAPAEAVKSFTPKNLAKIEAWTVPWHFLWSPGCYSVNRNEYSQKLYEDLGYFRTMEEIEFWDYPAQMSALTEWALPTVDDLNSKDIDLSSTQGISQTMPDQFTRELPYRYCDERGIGLVMLLDVRETDSLSWKTRMHRRRG
jgi:hypothetical protein